MFLLAVVSSFMGIQLAPYILFLCLIQLLLLPFRLSRHITPFIICVLIRTIHTVRVLHHIHMFHIWCMAVIFQLTKIILAKNFSLILTFSTLRKRFKGCPWNNRLFLFLKTQFSQRFCKRVLKWRFLIYPKKYQVKAWQVSSNRRKGNEKGRRVEEKAREKTKVYLAFHSCW